jgi:hypothetical protein
LDVKDCKVKGGGELEAKEKREEWRGDGESGVEGEYEE